MKFKVEECLLHHAKKDYSSDPKLDTQKVLPVVGRKAQPNCGQYEVVGAHEAVKSQHREILGCQESIRTLELDVDRSVELVACRRFHLKDVDAIL